MAGLRTAAPVSQWLDRLPEHQRKIVDRLRELVASSAPGSHESLRDGRLVYRATPRGAKRLVSITTIPGQVEVVFRYGSSLRDPHALLEGQKKHKRHLRLTTSEQLSAPAVRELFEEAWTEGLARVLPASGS